MKLLEQMLVCLLWSFLFLNDVKADLLTVEVAPIYDNPGETTTLAAAEVVMSLLTLMVKQPIKSKSS